LCLVRRLKRSWDYSTSSAAAECATTSSSPTTLSLAPDQTEWKERITWSDLAEVGILTTDQGPLQEDVFWVLLGRDGKSGCAIPQSSEGADRLLEFFQRLPDFQHDVVIKAMGSTNNAKFTCWQRPVA
jgi:hypothetical protein